MTIVLKIHKIELRPTRSARRSRKELKTSASSSNATAYGHVPEIWNKNRVEVPPQCSWRAQIRPNVARFCLSGPRGSIQYYYLANKAGLKCASIKLIWFIAFNWVRIWRTKICSPPIVTNTLIMCVCVEWKQKKS